MDETLKEAAREYHRKPTPGKISITPTTPLTTQRDLALAYSPGVAIPCEEIAKDPQKASEYTSRANLVAVISNGTAVLGLGDIGALASKPVMEGKSVLFKKFAAIDSIDIEVDETDIDMFVETVARLEPSFGGINLEDIKAPECFEIERRLRERMNIPVFHDDQHGTAIIVTAAFTNWIRYSGRDIKDIHLVASGAGASATACLKLLIGAGLPKENIIVTDRNGVVFKGRTEGMDPVKAQFEVETDLRSLDEAIEGADVFLGLSGPGVLKKEMVAKMADAPLIMALANPTPEIMPEEARQVKPDAIICTGRSDFPNQVNNVLCFPFLFRGALDVGATAINEEMKLACVKALADLTMEEATAEVAAVYTDEHLQFGSEYLIPKPFDPRLIVNLPIAVAKAAMESGVATRPIEDFDAYKETLTQYFYQSSMMMRPVYSKAKQDPKRIAFSEGEEENVLRATQVIVDEGLAYPILVGRRKVIETRIKRYGLRMTAGKNFDIVDPTNDPRYHDYWTTYHEIMERRGVTPDVAKAILRTNNTVIACLLQHKGDADAVICGTIGRFGFHMDHVVDVIGLKEGVDTPASLIGLVMPHGNLFICDTHVNPNPSATQICEMTLMAAEEMQRFGITPKVALLSHSNYGTHNDESALKMRVALAEIKMRMPDLEIDGEMHADSALSAAYRDVTMPNSNLEGAANLLVMPNADAANITYNALKVLAGGIPVGPILLGIDRPAHILTHATSVRGIVNVTALASVESQVYQEEHTAEAANE